MRWVSSSSNDVISFYSLSDGVQHVLPSLYWGKAVKKCMGPGSSNHAGDTQTSLHLRHREQQQPDSAQVGCWRGANCNAAFEGNSRQDGTASADHSGASSSAALSHPNKNSCRNRCFQESLCSSSTKAELSLRDAPTCCSDGCCRDVFRQQSLGHVTTCVFSGGWGGYDETEVTVGTTDGYVYALPALWPPPAAFRRADADKWGERNAVSACKGCGGAIVDEGGSAPFLLASRADLRDRATAADGAAQEDGTEETYSLPFPMSYVATPVKRYLRLPYTVQHLQMLGAHTPALAGEYHDELFWLQQQRHRQGMSAASCDREKSDVKNSESKERSLTARRGGHGCEWCGNASCVGCVSCRCGSRPLLSTYDEQFLTSSCGLRPHCYAGIPGTSSTAQTSAAAAAAAPADAAQSSGHFASRVQQFFSSDRLLLALDKGGNGVVAHWPAPPYLLDSPQTAFAFERYGQTECSVSSRSCCVSPPGTAKSTQAVPVSEAGCASEVAATTGSSPLAASFSLNLSVQCCANNPVATPLLAVVPSVVAAGGLRLLSVFDLVTTSFVFYARPPLTTGCRFARVESEQEGQPCPRQPARQHYQRIQQHVYAGEAPLRPSSQDPPRGRVWSNVCCLSSSPGTAAAVRQPGGARTACPSTSCSSATTVRGPPGPTTARNMPISVSSLTWLPALHPLLLGASTNSGLLLLYDLRVSPHPVFCASRSPPPRATASAATDAGVKGALVQTSCTSYGFAGVTRKPLAAKQGAPAPTLPQQPSAAPEAVYSAGILSGAATQISTQRACSLEITDKEPPAGQMTDSKMRRSSSVTVRSNGKEGELASEKKRGACRRCRSSSGCNGGKRRKIFSEGGRHSLKAYEEEPMSISFLATPAWLTSAATSHDAAILPCGCRCCRARTAVFRNVEAPSCVLSGADASTATLPVTKSHQQEKTQGCPESLSGAKSGPTHVRQSCGGHGPVEDECGHHGAGWTHDEKQPSPANEVERDADGTEEVSPFAGCAASVVLKPRNSSRPRPRFRNRAAAERGSSSLVSRRDRTATVRFAFSDSAEMPPFLLGSVKECPSDASYCKGCSVSGEAVSAASCAETCAARGDTRRKRRTCRKTRDASWRDRWFAKQEKALVKFFSEAHTALLSKCLRRNEVARAASVDTELSTTTEAADPLSSTNACNRCGVCSSVNCTTESALSCRRPAVRSGVDGKEKQEIDMPASNGEGGMSSARSQALRFASKTGVRTTNENGGAVGTAGCVACAGADQLTGPAPYAEQQGEVLPIWRLSRSGVAAGPDTSGELPFYLLRLASSPCSVLSGFPPTVGNSKQVEFLPSCHPDTEPSFCLPRISVAFMASCFFSVFARLLYAHRLDQHAAARRLSQHQQRQLLKLLHGVDCTESAVLSQGPSAVDSAIFAAAAAKYARAEASSATVAARAAGVDIPTPASAAAAGSDGVESDAPGKVGNFVHPSLMNVAAKRRSLQGVAGTGKPSTGLAGNGAAFQDTRLSFSACSGSSTLPASVVRTPESSDIFSTTETVTPLLRFERNLLSLYAEVLLHYRRSRVMPQAARSEESSTMLPVRDTTENILPDLFSRHAQNCMHLLRYAADVLYAFGDGAPVLAQTSAAAGKAVQAAAACAAGLESEKYLSCVPSPAAAYSAGIFAGDKEYTCAAARGKQGTSFNPNDVAVQQASNDAQEGMDNRQLRCGCGRVEAAVKAKARRWLAEEFVTEARMALRTSLNKSSMPSIARERSACRRMTREEASPCRADRECGRADGLGYEAQIVAAAHAVASSICLCELFQSSTFFPVLFFNIFRELRDRATKIPFCIQKNCIRSLPVSDVAYQKLARSQLRVLTRKPCGTRRISAIYSGGKQTPPLVNNVSDLPHQAVHAAAQATCPACSDYCDENVCRRSCVRRSLPHRAAAAGHVDGFDKTSRGRPRRPSKDQMRTQQLFCLDGRGRVYVLLVSLRIASDRSSEHRSGLRGRVEPATSNLLSLSDVGRVGNGRMATRWNHKQGEGCVADGPSSQQREAPTEHHLINPSWRLQSKGNEAEQKPDIADLHGGASTQLSDPVACSSTQVACCSDAAGGYVTTAEQALGERPRQPFYVGRTSSPGCSCMGKHLLWGSDETKELLQLEENEQESFCFSEQETGLLKRNNLHKKMWKERWLRRRRRIEWCGACRPAVKGTSCALPCTSGRECPADTAESVNSAEARETNRFSSTWGSCVVKCQERTQGGGDDVVCTEAGGDLTVSKAVKEVRLGRGHTRRGTRGMRAARKGVKCSARYLHETDKAAIAERVTRTAAAARLAQVNANMSLLRLFPLLPMWNSCSKPQYLWNLRPSPREGSCSQDCVASRPWTKAHSHIGRRCPQRKEGGGAAYAPQTETGCKVHSPFLTRASGTSIKLKEVSDFPCSTPEGASVAQLVCTRALQRKEESIELASPVASGKKIDGSDHGQLEEEERSGICKRICCRLVVEEEASFEINGKTSRVQLGSDSCRSRVVSVAIHENGRYVLAATCAPSFLLYSSSRADPLPPYEHKDRLLFGCATGTVPPSRPFRLFATSRGDPSCRAGSTCPSHANLPTVLLPGAPSGPRPPPPVLISASPILPAGAAAPFVPHTLLKRQGDHGVAYGVSFEGSVSTRRLVRCRSGMSVPLGRQSAHAEHGAGVRRSGDAAQTAFSDWLTDEEDEKELHGGASGSETGSASDA